MTTASILLLALKASIALTVFVIGLNATVRDATHLLRHPALLLKSFLAMNVVMPLLVLLAARAFALPRAVELALVALSISAVPPLLPKKVAKAGGDESYVIGLLAGAALFAIVTIPLSIALLADLFDLKSQLQASDVARLVGVSVLAPLAIGIAARQYMPSIAKRIAKPLGILSTVVLVACVIPILATSWPAMKSLIGNGTLVAIIALTLLAVGVGYALGGPQRDQRIVLALATATRHPGLAIAIAAATFPNEKLVSAAVILYLIVASIVTAPFVARQKRDRQSRVASPRPWVPARNVVARDSIGRVIQINERRR